MKDRRDVRPDQIQAAFIKEAASADRPPYVFANISFVQVHGSVAQIGLGEILPGPRYLPRAWVAMALGDARALRDTLTAQIAAAEAMTGTAAPEVSG